MVTGKGLGGSNEGWLRGIIRGWETCVEWDREKCWVVGVGMNWLGGKLPE